MRKNNLKRKEKFTIIFVLLTGALFIYSPFAMFRAAQAAGTITGTVYTDYNMNGARNVNAAAPNYAVDAGVGGVTVVVYDSSGTARGTATTCTALNNPTTFCTGNNNGAYTISATGTGPYRIEFTNLPSGSYPSQTGADNATTVQFVPDGNSSTVDLGIIEPIDYCQNVPYLVTNTYAVGAGNFDTIARYPYNYSDELDGRLNSVDPTAWTAPPSRTSALDPTGIATTDEVGTTFGLAWNNIADKVYSAAYLKRGAKFGGLSSESTGAIYVTSSATGVTPTTAMYVNLNTVFGATTAGTNPHPTGSTPDWNNDPTLSEIGKVALGGLKLSQDRTQLYTVNLADKKLYVIPTSGALNSTTISRYSIPTSNLTTGGGTCASADVRPFAVGRDRAGQIYVGAVCSAESETSDAKLHAFVWRFSGGAFTLVANNTLTFARTAATGESATWQRWANVTGVLNRAAPMLTDIEFDGANMILGLRDRYGDQVVTPTYYRGYGDVMRACASGSTFNFESNGSCGGITAGGAGTSEGNGGGEYYTDLNGDSREEGALGGLVQVPGFNHVVSTFYDPVTYNSSGTRVSNFFTAGIQRYSNRTGAMTGAYDLYLQGDAGTFGKADGNGDSEVLCAAAPIQIGNRVWRDTDGDGVQDAGENGIQNVTVRLYQGSTLIATAVTDANGEFYFSSASGTNTTSAIYNLNILPATAYEIRLDLAANYSSGGALNGLLLTTRNQTTQAGFTDGSDSDASLVTNPTGSPAGRFAVTALTTGVRGESNHTYDFGFTSSATYSLGNRVWFDTNNDGQINAGELGIAGVSVSIFADANADGVPDNINSPVATQTTDASGYYRFDGLAAGNYVVRLNPSNFANAGVLGGRQNTTGNTNADLDSTSVAGQNGEDGINPAGAANSVQTNGILSGTYTLGAPGEPTNEADVQSSGQGAVDAAANLTVDYGFYRLNLSGTVWNDNGAGANSNNGILNAGENGLASKRVQLYSSSNTEILVGADGILGTSDDAAGGMLTDASGNYNFQGLPPGQYRVVVTFAGANSSTPTSTTPDNNIDNDDNGFPDNTGNFTGKIISGLVTLTPGSTGALNNNTVTNSSGTTSNPTVDFGFALGPTAVRLEKFDAFTDGKTAVLKWSTGEESGNLGFNIYRESNGERRLLNAAPIAGNALRTSAELAASGSDYTWTDKEFSADAVYYLEDLDTNGNANLNGAVAPEFKLTLADEPNAAMLSDLSNVKDSSGEKEIVSEQIIVNPADKKSSQLLARQRQIAAQGGVKISVKRDGWYRISADELQSAGFDLNSNRSFRQLFTGGAEVPFKLNADDSIEFFGRGLDTALTDRQVYYLVNGQTAGLRVREIDGGKAGDVADARSFPVTVERKDRVIYSSAIINGDEDNWFGAIVNQTNQTVQELTVRNLDANGQAHLSVKLQGIVAVNHSVNVRFNDVELGTVNLNNLENRQFDFDLPASSVREGVNRIYLQSTGGASDASLVDSIRLSYRRGYAANANQLRFTVPANQTARVGGFTDEKIRVYEIADGAASRQVAGSDESIDGTFGFSLSAANYDREMLAVGNSFVEQPASVERNAPSSWNSAANKADFVIVTSNELRGQAETLASMREAQGLKTQVVMVDDLFDEFTFGEYDPQAVKQFLKLAATDWKTKPRYALLFGDASYDTRNRLGLAAPRDIVPTRTVDTEFMETSSDGWLADFDDDGIEDIALGRIPVGNQTEATAAIEKLARFDNQTPREEKSDVLISDRAFENYSADLQSLLPGNVRSFRVDRSALDDAEMHANIVERLNANPLVVTYTGHGSTNVWASSGVFKRSDAAALNNSKLSFYLLMTCLNGYTFNATGDSLAESLFKSERGAIAVWTSSGVTNPDRQFAASQAFTRTVFNAAGKSLRIGDVVKSAKQATDDADVRRTWQLVGDPTIFVR